MIPISNTEVTTFNTCERRHYYEFILGLEPRLFALPLHRGIVGHMALEQYYANGQDLDAARDVLKTEYIALQKEHPLEFKHQEAISDLVILLERYHDYHGEEPFEVLELETTHTAQMAPGIHIGAKLDMLIQYTKGPYRGDIAVMDSKFVLNFKSQTEMEMDAQGPKYVKLLQSKGVRVTKFVFNQLRHRAMKDFDPAKHFQRPVIKIDPIEAERIWYEHLEAAKRIVEVKEKGLGPNARRALHVMLCKGCPVQRLCKAELGGRDISRIVEMEFKPKGTFNGYGYADVSE